MTRRRGVLLIGHGTRDLVGMDEFTTTARQVANRLGPMSVEFGFLELAHPTIDSGFEKLIAQGVREVLVAPLLLFAAAHAKDDIPTAIRRIAARHPHVSTRYAEHLGCHPRLLDLSVRRLREAVHPHEFDTALTALVVVGRGSRDPTATQETHAYAQLVAQQVGLREVRVGFLAMAKPDLQTVFAAAAADSRVRTIVVQPHLLFHGDLLARTREQVRYCSARHSNQTWLAAGHLGPAVELTEAIVERCRWAFEREDYKVRDDA